MLVVRRKDDTDARTRFRSDRFCQEGGKWYFFTREGSMEGPFDHRPAAEDRLADYVKIMTSGMMSEDSELSVLPQKP